MKKLTKRTNWILVICILSVFVMIALVIASMFYFSDKIHESSKIIESLDYQKYDNYYVMITDHKKSAFWQSVYNGANEMAAQSGAYVEMLGNNLSVEYGKNDLMKIAINSKVDGIIIDADDSIMMTDLIKQAENAEIPVVTVMNDNTKGGRQSFICVASYNLAREYGKQICEIVSQKKQNIGESQKQFTAMVLMDEQNVAQNTLLPGINEMIESLGMGDDVKVESTLVKNDSAFAAEENIRDIFMKSKNLPDIIVCLNEQNTTCVYQTVVDYNKVGKVEIVGYYESDTIRSAIKKEIIHSSISVDTRQMGAKCVQALNEYKETGYVSDYLAVDTFLLNSENIEDSAEGGADETAD